MVAGVYAATAAALAFLVLFAIAAWVGAAPRQQWEEFGLTAAITAAALLARGAGGARARRPGAQVFRYIIWVPLLLGGPASLAVVGFWWAIVTVFLMPRAPAFQPAGLRVEADRHPRLHAVVTEAAQAAGVRAPESLYLDLGAGVTLGRRPGARSERALVLGLYALALLEPEHLGALLRHEFGHETGNRWERLAHRVHAHCFRLLGRPEQLDLGAYLFFPRLALSLRATRSAAAAQEAWADAQATGGDAGGAVRLGAARLRLAVAGAALIPYHQQGLAPVLGLGCRPGLIEGMRHWLAGPPAEGALRAARLEMAPRLMPRYGVHPPRSAEAELAPFSVPPESASALACLDAPWLVEERLLRLLGLRLKTVAWEGVARELYLHHWEQVLSEHGTQLRGWTPRRVPELCQDLDAVGRQLLQDQAANYMPGYRIRMAETILGISLALCVQRAGWNVYDLPGQPLWLEPAAAAPPPAPAQRIEPFALVTDLQAGRTSAEEFWAQCAAVGILDEDLSGTS